MEIIALQADFPLELLPNTNQQAILSCHSQEIPNKLNKFKKKIIVQAIFRIIEHGVNKFEIKLRTVEGQYGPLNCFIIPFATPKTCQVISNEIKPLSLHELTELVRTFDM